MSPLRLLFLAISGICVGHVSATELMLPGDYHGDEISARDGDTWFALVQDEHGSTLLQPRSVAIEAVNDPVLDDETGASRKRVGAAHDDVLFYLRDLPGAASGTVATAYSANGDPLSLAGLDHAFHLFGQGAGRLWMSCSEGNDVRECALQLSRGSRDQVLGTWSASTAAGESQLMLGSDAWPHLRWAGDVDRDGQLDLLIDMTDHYNVSAPTLFLSSQAKDGELVGAAAVLRSVGC